MKLENFFFRRAQITDIDSYKKMLRYDKKSLVFMDIFAYIPVLTILLIYRLLKMHVSGLITIGEAMVAFNAVRSMSSQLWKATAMFGDVLIDISRCRDALNIFTIPHRVSDDFSKNPLKTDGFTGSVEFADVNFVYSDLNNEEEGPLLEDLNLKIEGKTKVALVGASGSGKSTIISLLTRVNEPIQGIITINNQNIKTVSRDSIANTISSISQISLLFQRSIFENIGYGSADFRDFLLKQNFREKLQFYKIPQNLQTLILEAAKKAGAHGFIIELPNGYDSIYGNEINLSGGQKQRLMIARAFANTKAQIMVLDEATSALDSETDIIIKNVLDKMEITIIMVAHKLNMIKNFDRIVVFERGSMIEDGTHDELLAKRGRYCSLWSAQS
jgi:ATP-binding cassette subfamily B protein